MQQLTVCFHASESGCLHPQLQFRAVSGMFASMGQLLWSKVHPLLVHLLRIISEFTVKILSSVFKKKQEGVGGREGQIVRMMQEIPPLPLLCAFNSRFSYRGVLSVSTRVLVVCTAFDTKFSCCVQHSHYKGSTGESSSPEIKFVARNEEIA